MNSFWHSLGTMATNGYTFSDGLSEMRDARTVAQHRGVSLEKVFRG